jgi:LysM repeat protein
LRKWTKSACVALACGFLVTLVVVAVGMTAGPQAQASTRIAKSTTQVAMTSTPTVAAAPVAPAKTADPATKYVVQSGDTLSGIAVALAVRGGWPALYAANRHAIGPDPDVIHPGTVLMLPGLMLAGQPASVRYTVAAGDTLSGIAAALDVPGGWPALYAANRHAIGPDPDVIHPGTVLTIAPSSTHASRPSAPASRSSSPVRHPRPTPSRAPAGRPHRTLPTRTSTQALSGMPGWLQTMLLAVGLLIGAAFLTELGLAIVRRRRRAVAQCAPLPLACNGNEPAAGSLSGEEEEEPRIVLADYDRLVVTHNKADDMVYVLRPPGADPKTILRVARLVLTEDPYEELADRLGVPASWPMD